MFIVTGGAGLIGSAAVEHLNLNGINDILIVDDLNHPAKKQNILPLKYSDYLDKTDFRKLFNSGSFDGRKIDGILHFGACSSTIETEWNYLLDNNFRYTVELAEFAIRHHIRMVYASSCATYGDGSNGYKDDESALERLRPLNLYARSKHEFDLFAKKNRWLDNLTGCKFTNIFGPGEYHKGEMRSMVLKAFESILQTGKVKLFASCKAGIADGEQKRDFLYVKDAVAMVWQLFCRSDAVGIFNIGSGKAESWNDLIAAVFNAMQKEINIEYIPMPEKIRNQYQYYTCADMSKFNQFGFDCKNLPLAGAVRDYVVNFLIPERESRSV